MVWTRAENIQLPCCVHLPFNQLETSLEVVSLWAVWLVNKDVCCVNVGRVNVPVGAKTVSCLHLIQKIVS